MLRSAEPHAALFCLHWLKARGRPAALIAPLLPTLDEAKPLGAIARHFGATLSFDASTLARLGSPGQWTGGRWNCRMDGGGITAAAIQAVAVALRG